MYQLAVLSSAAVVVVLVRGVYEAFHAVPRVDWYLLPAILAIGLALQGTLSHVASGVMLIIFRPFRIGDRIIIDKHRGVVETVGFRSTRIRTDKVPTEIDTLSTCRALAGASGPTG